MVRRDLNNLTRDRDGNFSESKTIAIAFKVVMIYVFVTHATEVLKDSMVLLVFVIGIIAPELLKKFMEMRLGGNGNTTETKSSRSSSTSTTTQKEQG